MYIYIKEIIKLTADSVVNPRNIVSLVL